MIDILHKMGGERLEAHESVHLCQPISGHIARFANQPAVDDRSSEEGYGRPCWRRDYEATLLWTATNFVTSLMRAIVRRFPMRWPGCLVPHQ